MSFYSGKLSANQGSQAGPNHLAALCPVHKVQRASLASLTLAMRVGYLKSFSLWIVGLLVLTVAGCIVRLWGISSCNICVHLYRIRGRRVVILLTAADFRIGCFGPYCAGVSGIHASSTKFLEHHIDLNLFLDWVAVLIRVFLFRVRDLLDHCVGSPHFAWPIIGHPNPSKIF